MNPTRLDNASALTPNMLLKFKQWTIMSLEKIVAEYVPTLQNRRKWRRPQFLIKLGDFVLDSDINLHHGERPPGRIDIIQPGKDGHLRIESILVAEKETSNDRTTLPPGEFMLRDVFLFICIVD